MSVTSIAHYRLGEGPEAEHTLALLRPVALATRAEEGNLYFHAVRDASEPGHLILIEGWRDADALAAHRETAHFRGGLLGAVVPRLLGREVFVGAPALGPELA